MCGIVGCISTVPAAPLLLEGLGRLEYRGYDSAGIALLQDNGSIVRIRAEGKLERLREKTSCGKAVPGTCGIGHTRWATHGPACEKNAHPILSSDGKVCAVHNGIIENSASIKSRLEREGWSFSTDTDTESAVNLIAQQYAKTHDPLEAIALAAPMFKGSYALAIVFQDVPDTIFAARKGSPMVICKGEDMLFAASDTLAYSDRIEEAAHMPQESIAVIANGQAKFYDFCLCELDVPFEEYEKPEGGADKAGFEDYMLKEIFEQPDAIRRTLEAYLDQDGAFLDPAAWQTISTILADASRLTIVGCGSAWHAGLIGKHVFEKLCQIPVTVELGSEYRSQQVFGSQSDPAIFISQSGETADTIESLRHAAAKDVPTIAIVNVEGSALTRLADATVLTKAGPEISVATTKAYSTQLIVLDLLAMLKSMLERAGWKPEYVDLSCEERESDETQLPLSPACQEKLFDLLSHPDALFQEELDALRALPGQICRILEEKERVQWLAGKTGAMERIFFLGRGEDHALALEGALKLKEVSYIHSEAYAAGEMKHGTISLIEPGVFCVGILMQDDLYSKTISNLHEVATRGAYLIALTRYGRFETEDTADFTIYVPETIPVFSPSLAIVPLQLFAYYAAACRGLDIDKPRNLAKSVTVE